MPETLWTAVLAHGEAALDAEQSPGDIPAIRDALAAIHPALRLFWRRADDGNHVVISLEGDLSLGPLVDAALDACPESDRWVFGSLVDSGLLRGERDPALFPDDENGDVILRMALHGDRIWRARPMDFAVLLPDEAAADAFAAALPPGAEAESWPAEDPEDGLTWEVNVVREMVPSHAAITLFESALDVLASAHGGTTDGWGSMSQ